LIQLLQNNEILDLVILFIKGFIIGLLASMPVGAIAIMTVQRTMNNGLWAGFSLGLGAAAGDLIYATIAGFGISIIKDFLLDNKMWISLVGGVFIIFIGYKIFKSDTVKQYRKKVDMSRKKMANDFFSSFILALTNPGTILGFTWFFATAGVVSHETTPVHIVIMLSGIILGATNWWFTIAFFVNKFKEKISLRNIVMINRFSGIFIILFGFAMIIIAIFFKNLL